MHQIANSFVQHSKLSVSSFTKTERCTEDKIAGIEEGCRSKVQFSGGSAQNLFFMRKALFCSFSRDVCDIQSEKFEIEWLKC